MLFILEEFKDLEDYLWKKDEGNKVERKGL
jgi:hypothetical protein